MIGLTIIACAVFPNPTGISLEELELEQPGLKLTSCETCEGECWISEKKRYIVKALKIEKKPYEIMCWKCVADYKTMCADKVKIKNVTPVDKN